MAFPAGTGNSSGGTGSVRPDHHLDGHDWIEPEKPRRDWLKLTIVVGLGLLSWVATYVGMLELIQANMGDLPLVHKAIIAFSVAMLMVMVVWLLDRIFSPIGAFTRTVYIAGYLFLTLISVGFGFGFYWKVLESRSESSRSAESAVGQVQQSLHAASTRLEQLQATLAQLTEFSAAQANVERTKGTSCPNSRPGDGPRRKLREDDAARFGFASEFVKGRVTAVNGELGALNGDLAKIVSDDKSLIDAKSGTRNEFLKSLGRKLDMTVTGFNAFRTDPQLKQIRTDLAERADKSSFPDGKGATFACPDPQLSPALKGVVRAIDQLPELEKPKIAAVEGSEATIEAFRRLTATFYGLLSFKLPRSADEIRDLQKKAVQSVENPSTMAAARSAQGEAVGLSKRDYVPLAIAIFVDICLLLVSMSRPVNRLHSLVPKMRAAERGPVIQILSRFNDIHRDRQIRENFEIFRHVVFDYAGNYYVAVPLDAPPKLNPKEREDLRVEAQLLANLFASFEKDNIFKRIDNRFLAKLTWSEPNAARARRRLKQQGSKFAQAEAFRLYRFNDGAWSEIILGAVMGAAKRVESEKRRRVIEEGHKLPDARPGARPAPIPAVFPAAQTVPAPVGGQYRPAPAAATTAGPDRSTTGVGDRRHVAVPPARPPFQPPMPAPAAQVAAAPAAHHFGADVEPPHPHAVGQDQGAAAAGYAAQFGPYARHVASAQAAATRPGEPTPRAPRVYQQETGSLVANNNTGPGSRRTPPAGPPLTAAYTDPQTTPSTGSAARNPLHRVAISDKVVAMPGVHVQPQGVIEPAGIEIPARKQDHSGTQSVAPPVARQPVEDPARDSVTLEIKTATITAPASDPRMQAALWRAGLISRTLRSEAIGSAAEDTPKALTVREIPEAKAAQGPDQTTDEPETDDAGIRIDMISRRFAPRAGD